MNVIIKKREFLLTKQDVVRDEKLLDEIMYHNMVMDRIDESIRLASKFGLQSTKVSIDTSNDTQSDTIFNIGRMINRNSVTSKISCVTSMTGSMHFIDIHW